MIFGIPWTLTMEREALTLEALAIAMAVRNSGGIVFVQSSALRRRQFEPAGCQDSGIPVDCVVVAEKAEHHWQTFATPYSSAYSGE